MKFIIFFFFNVISMTLHASSAPLSHTLPVFESYFIHFWHSNAVDKATMDAVYKLDPKANTITIVDWKLRKKILDSYGLEENVEIVDLNTGKKSQHKIGKLALSKESGECLYKYKNYFHAEMEPKSGFKKNGEWTQNVGIVLPRSMNIINVSQKIVEQIADYFSKDKEAQRFTSLMGNTKKLPTVIGLKKASEEYFITAYPVPDMGATYYVFQVKENKVVKSDELDFPPCGS